MKVERISDNQVKVILYSSDLSDRNIDITELAYGTERTVGLFRDMMDQAMVECGFQSSNTPLMIEATPLSMDSLMLIITKLDESVLEPNGLNFLSEITKMRERKNLDGAKGRIKNKVQETVLIFSFKNLDDAALAAQRLAPMFTGSSAVIKKDGLYNMIIDNNQKDDRPPLKTLEAIMFEYGSKQPSNHLAVSHLKEYGESLIAEDAVQKLARYMA